jgi:hypothetical protein
MKTLTFVSSVLLSAFFGSQFIGLNCMANSINIQSSAGSTAGYQIGQQGANYSDWLKIIQTTNSEGGIVLTTNLAFVELATGLNYKDLTTGHWLPTKEEIDGHPGGAIAQYGQHKVIFANNLTRRSRNQGVVVKRGHGRQDRSLAGIV